MDRHEEIGAHGVRARDPRGQFLPVRTGRDKQHGLGEAGVQQLRLDPPRQPQIEIVLRHAAGAGRAGLLRRMADVENDPERGAIAF